MKGEKTKYAFAIHGGAGTVSRTHMAAWKERAYKEALNRALMAGVDVLEKGGKAVDAVVESISTMEDCALFNAGKGSVFTHKGDHEMDAAIMDGSRLKAGAVSGVQLVKNPILLAQRVMKSSRHVLLGGKETLDFAKKYNIELRPKEYFYEEFRYKQWLKAKSKDEVVLDHDVEEKKYGTVGAVALDHRGNLAAGTSTGGMVNKKFGRVGDSPIIGAGTYANENCAVSCTGHGEYFIRLVVAHDLACVIQYTDQDLRTAAEHIIYEKLKNIGGRGGLIAVDKNGHIVMPFNTKGMYRACKREGEEEYIGIYS